MIISVSLSLLLCITGFIVLCSIDEPISIQDKANSDIDLSVTEDGKQTVTEIPEGLSAKEWDDIQVRLQESRCYPIWSQTTLGYVTSNPRHQWGITYDEGAVLVNPSSGKDWSWLLTPASYGYRGNMVPMTDDPEVVVNENRIEFVYSKDLTGWYINDEKGLEHGFTLASSPHDRTEGNLLFEMSLETSLTSKLINHDKNIIFLDNSGSEILNYGKLLVTDAEGHIIPSELLMTPNSVTISVDDTNAVYPLMVDPLLVTMINKIVSSDGAEGDQFGGSVSISGDTAVVGAYLDDIGGNTDQGSVYIFQRHQGGLDNWGNVVKLIASDGESTDLFGRSVSIIGDTVVVGAPLGDGVTTGDKGAAYIFKRNYGGPDNWGMFKKIIASDGLMGDSFGHSVSIDGDTIVVGAPLDAVGGKITQGSAYIFQRNFGGTDNWGEVTKLTASDGSAGDYFGISVSISIDTVAVGADGDVIDGNIGQGSAYIFQRDEGGIDNWGEVVKVIASDGEDNDVFGNSISINDDTLVVGSFQDTVGANSAQGSAYVFQRNSGGVDNWGEVAWLSADDGETDDMFGDSVSINGDMILIGVSMDDIDGNENQGSVYVYDRNQGGENNWGKVDKLTALDGESGDAFGNAVSIISNTFIIGAWADNISGNDGQGSAYIYYLGSSNNIPAITTPDNTTAYEDSQYITDYEADDVDGDPLTWSLWTDANGWLTIDSNTGVLSGTPDNSDVGTWTVNVSVSDNKGGIDFSNFTLTVENTNDAPVITTSNVNSANVDELYSVDYEAGDDDLDTLSWDVDTNASWLFIDSSSGILSGFPDESDVGSYSVNVSVSDSNGGNDFTFFTLTVLNPNNAPVIITDDVLSAFETVLYSVDYEATDEDQDTLTWSLDTNASWLSIQSSSGILSGTPESSDIGSYWVEVSVSDGNGGSDLADFTLEVFPDNDGDGIADDEDSDDDNDGYLDDIDEFPEDEDEWMDTDSDGTGDNADEDDDDDDIDDNEDDFPLDPAASTDTDGDGKPDDWNEGYNEGDSTTGLVVDDDDDDDGVPDIDDKYPLDSSRSKDTEEQESIYLYILLILIIIIALILIMVSVQKNKKIKTGETLVAPFPAQPAIQFDTQNLRCPQCQNLFEAPLDSTTIQCPYCGYSAKLQ